MFKNIALFIGAITILAIWACAPKEAIKTEKPLEPVAAPVEKVEWEAKWEKTLEAARKEGKVVIYAAPGLGGTLREHAFELFEKRYGFTLEVVAARGQDAIRKIVMERNAGLFVPDIYTSGEKQIYTNLKPMGAVEVMEPALILPEVLDPNLWLWGKLPWGDEERKVLLWSGQLSSEIAINTTMVKPKEIKSYYDLLEPKWKGKIVADDPTLPGVKGFSDFVGLLENKIMDVDFFRQLVAKQEITLIRDQHLQIRWLAMGKFSVAFSPGTALIASYLAEGAPISLIMFKEASILSMGGTGVALMNKAPHPNSAKIFLNWYLSREGQRIMQGGVQKQSLRVDVPTDNLRVVRQPGVEYFPDLTVTEKFVLQEMDKYMTLVKEIYEPLLK